MTVIEKNISQFIQNQFPAIYREEGETFVEFVKQYYAWMEDPGNVLYHGRRQIDYKDIDDTIDDFVVMFKQKYLADIQLDTVTYTRKLVKNSLDLYRAKGTERAIDVFFRAVFGTDAEVYYPGDDVFRLSDGKWIKPKYLEISTSKYNNYFVGKQIVGINSGATAFVERYIRRKIKSKYIDIFYISAINGEFETNEQVTLSGEVLKDIPKVIGSLTSLQIIAGGGNFVVGDIVSLNSDNGVQGKGRVSGISDLIGTIDFKIDDYGWGYTQNAEVIISQKVLTLQNVKTVETTRSLQYDIFETIKQPTANISIINANNDISALANGTMLYTYYSNNVVAGIGRVMSYTANGATNGEIYVAEIKNTVGTVVEPAANSTGTVSVTEISTPIAGVSTSNITSNTITGVGTSFSSDLKVGAIIKLYAYNSSNGAFLGSQVNKISTIANSTQLTLSTNAIYTSTNVSIVLQGGKIITGTSTAFNTDFVYGDTVAVYSNSSNYILRTVNAVTNSTYMTLQQDMTFTNAAANYAKVTYANNLYIGANTYKANVTIRVDNSTTANIMGVSSNLVIYTANQNLGAFANNEYVFQVNSLGYEIASAKVKTTQSTIGANSIYALSNSVGVFLPDSTFPVRTRYANGLVTGKTANLVSLDLTVGVIDIDNTFTNTTYNYIYGTNSLSNATLIRISSQGVFANMAISNVMQYPETLHLGSEPVANYLNVPLNSVRYGFLYNPSANGQTEFIQDCFNDLEYTIGGISSIISVNPGKNYDITPFVLIYDPLIAQFNLHDYVIEIANPTQTFTIGEVVTQEVSGAMGIVKSANITHAVVRRIQYANIFDTTHQLSGKLSKASANVISVSPDNLSLPIGIDAVVLANLQTSTGSVTTLEVYDSGFGYANNEDITFTSADGTHSGLARAGLGKYGQSEGFYVNRKGQLSDSKFIFDGDYYQDYSYEIRSSISPDKYKEMLKKVLHVAGTKAFSATVISQVANTSSNVITEITEE